MNGFSADRYTLLVGNLTDKISGTFDVIAANIVADAIIQLSGGIQNFMNDNSVYIVSGIIDQREADVAAALARFGFQTIARHEDNGWICLECRRK